MCGYQAHDEMLRRLKKLEVAHPDLVRVGSIGKSVRGADLVYVKLSENVTQRGRGEPMFKFVANMHGDETLGRQMLLYMAEYLAIHYAKDEVRPLPPHQVQEFQNVTIVFRDPLQSAFLPAEGEEST